MGDHVAASDFAPSAVLAVLLAKITENVVPADVTGRIKDAIIRKAENVSALAVENVLATPPRRSPTSQSSESPPRTGERVCAVVVPTTADTVSLESLIQHCRSQELSRCKHPERLEIVDALPHNPYAELIKKDLRNALADP